jgi:hypothetical protein
MSLDISLDLPQIMGRQRLDENIFKHEAILFYKSTKTVLSEEDFERFIQQKINETDTLLSEYNNMSTGGKVAYSKTLRENIIAYKYKNNFVGVSEKTGLAVYNKLVELSHRRAWEIQQLNYKDEVTVLKSLQEEGFNSKLYTEENLILIQEFLNEFNQDKNFERCMRLYCTFLDQYPFLFQIILKISDIPTTFHMYYELLGHSGIKSYAYKEYALRNEVEIKLQNPSVKEAILFNFQPGNKYSNKYVKEKLKEIYNQFNFNKSPKASDLEEYFLLKKVQFKEGDKRVDGFLIENIK